MINDKEFVCAGLGLKSLWNELHVIECSFIIKSLIILLCAEKCVLALIEN